MPRLSREEYEERLRQVRLLVLDVDGVCTAGGIVFIDDDREAKVFCVRDGSALFIAQLLIKKKWIHPIFCVGDVSYCLIAGKL